METPPKSSIISKEKKKKTFPNTFDILPETQKTAIKDQMWYYQFDHPRDSIPHVQLCFRNSDEFSKTWIA